MKKRVKESRKLSLLCAILVSFAFPISMGVADGGVPRRNVVRSFEECVAESGKILKMYPPKCVTQDGHVFVETPKEQKSACENKCGDGECQEMVCMAVGCPCAENQTNCPKDCSDK